MLHFGAVLVRFCFYTYQVQVPIHRIAKATDDNGNAAALGLLNAEGTEKKETIAPSTVVV